MIREILSHCAQDLQNVDQAAKFSVASSAPTRLSQCCRCYRTCTVANQKPSTYIRRYAEINFSGICF